MTPERIKELRGLLADKDRTQATLDATDPRAPDWDALCERSVDADYAYNKAADEALPSLLDLAERALSVEASVAAWRDFARNAVQKRTAAEAREQALREALRRTNDHLKSWAAFHPLEATAETLAILHCNSDALAQGDKADG